MGPLFTIYFEFISGAGRPLVVVDRLWYAVPRTGDIVALAEEVGPGTVESVAWSEHETGETFVTVKVRVYA